MVYITEENVGEKKTKFYIRFDRIYLKFAKIKLVMSTLCFLPFLHFAATAHLKNIIKMELDHKELDTISKL